MIYTDLFDQEVLRAFYKSDLVNFHSEANLYCALRMRKEDLACLLLGRVAGPNNGNNQLVQELQDGVNELANMDEMAFVNIHSVHLGIGRDLTLWTRETHRIQVDHQLIRQVVAATVMHVFSLFVVVQLLGPPDSPPRSWVREGENMDRPYSGLDWALLTAAFLGNVRITKALLGRSQGNDRPDGLLSTGLEVAASQGHFDTVVAFLEGSVNPNEKGSCKGFPSACGNALVQACTEGHEKIVDLLLEPRYGIKKKGLQYEKAVLNAARGRPDEGHGYIRIL